MDAIDAGRTSDGRWSTIDSEGFGQVVDVDDDVFAGARTKTIGRHHFDDMRTLGFEVEQRSVGDTDLIASESEPALSVVGQRVGDRVAFGVGGRQRAHDRVVGCVFVNGSVRQLQIDRRVVDGGEREAPALAADRATMAVGYGV